MGQVNGPHNSVSAFSEVSWERNAETELHVLYACQLWPNVAVFAVSVPLRQ